MCLISNPDPPGTPHCQMAWSDMPATPFQPQLLQCPSETLCSRETETYFIPCPMLSRWECLNSTHAWRLRKNGTSSLKLSLTPIHQIQIITELCFTCLVSYCTCLFAYLPFSFPSSLPPSPCTPTMCHVLNMQQGIKQERSLFLWMWGKTAPNQPKSKFIITNVVEYCLGKYRGP